MAGGKFAMNSRRLLTSSPQAILNYSSAELFEAIKMSESRTITAVARSKGPNIVDGVTNAELCAAFGADIVALGIYDPNNPCFPGLPSKYRVEPDDTILEQVQTDIGRGWTLSELRSLIGRPIASGLFGIEENYAPGMAESFNKKVVANRKNARLLVDQGCDIIQFMDWMASREQLKKTIRELKDEIGDSALLSFARPNGYGLFNEMGRKEFITENEIIDVIDAGCQIVEIPAVGTIPGFTVESVTKLVSLIHEGGALANLWIATSQEGADTDTIKRIGFYSKMTGADILTISDVWTTESVPNPENILALSIAVRGVRHTYRRMAFSINR